MSVSLAKLKKAVQAAFVEGFTFGEKAQARRNDGGDVVEVDDAWTISNSKKALTESDGGGG